MDLNNLEYLNLENNRISFIEASSFSNLINLKTLILSRNQIVFIKETYYLFDTLSNLQLLKCNNGKILISQGQKVEYFYEKTLKNYEK